MLVVYGALADGATVGLLGLTLGVLWAFIARSRPQSKVAAAAPVATRRTILKIAASGVAAVGLLGAAPYLATRSRQSPAQRTLAPTPTSSNLPMSGRQTATTVAAEGTTNPSSAGGAPNVVLITIDTLRADQIGAYGNLNVQTPALDAFASQGARFAMHMVQQPQTNPSHATLFTGMYPSSSGMRIHMVDKLADNIDTLAAAFHRAGYATAGLFSWMSFEPQYCGLDRGFDVYQDLTVNTPTILSNPAVKEASAGYRVAEEYLTIPKAANELIGINQKVETAAKGRADTTTDAALAQLATFGDRPFFLWVHYFDPHYPFQPPAPYDTLYDKDYQGPIDGAMQTVYDIQIGRLKPTDSDLRHLLALYQGELSFMDSQLQRLFASLDDRGLSSKTIVAVTGDHGESFAEHADFQEGGNVFHPHNLYNVEQRVPLLLRYPPAIQAGSVVTVPTQGIDLPLTLLELAGLPPMAQAQGKSLLDVLMGNPAPDRVAFGAMADYVFTSIVTSRLKLIQNNATGQRRLFDLSADPQELTDIASAQYDASAQLAGRLSAWMHEVKIA
jgi:arylsulfatase A-like enzyme